MHIHIKSKSGKFLKPIFSMCNFWISRVPRYVFADHKTTHEVFKKTYKAFNAFFSSSWDTMNPKNTANINLAKKLMKHGYRQEVVLAGVAEHLTEEEKSYINLTQSKMDQLSNNVKFEEDTPYHQKTKDKSIFEAFFTLFKHELCPCEESDKMDCLMFSSVENFRFETDLYNSSSPKNCQRYITELIIFENQANQVLQFPASDRRFIYSKMRENCLQTNITWKEYIIVQKLSYTTVKNHNQFHELVVEFPRVLISSAGKTEWFKFIKQFKGARRVDDSIKMRLAASLKEFVGEDSLFENFGENLKN